MNPLLACTTALLLGSMHALEADHIAAVTAFAVRKPAPLAAVRFGIRWALGHGVSVIGVGILMLLLGLALPAAAEHWLERGVGVTLIALGTWTAWHAAHLHSHEHQHDGTTHTHLHSHAYRTDHEHEHAATMVGALHGLAGAAPAVALLQLSLLPSWIEGIAYLVLFAVGTALGMSVYALATGYLMGRMAIASALRARLLGKLTGLATISIGLYWVLRR
jgi:ABC-type nickel/cobalt efflux system permease component RcnA